MNSPPPTIAEVRGRCNSEDGEKNPPPGSPRRRLFSTGAGGGGRAARQKATFDVGTLGGGLPCTLGVASVCGWPSGFRVPTVGLGLPTGLVGDARLVLGTCPLSRLPRPWSRGCWWASVFGGFPAGMEVGAARSVVVSRNPGACPPRSAATFRPRIGASTAPSGP